MNAQELDVLAARVQVELRNIRQLEDELAAKGLLGTVQPDRQPFDLTDSFSLRAVGSVLHDFYVAAENIFEMVARMVDEYVPNDPDWHTALLKQMSAELYNRRPAVIRPETFQILNEFRSFRHVFRNVYGFSLSAERLQALVKKLPEAARLLADDLGVFIKAMRQVVVRPM